MDPGAENSVKSVRKSKEEKKLLRKQIKSSHVLLKHEGISATSQPTKSLVVSNGGLGNGVSREELSAALRAVGALEALIMPPHKPYAFVTYRSEESARKAHVQLNGERLPCAESSVTLYLSYVDSVPCEEERPLPLPEGLVLVEEFVSLDEEALLLAAIDWSSADDVTAQKALKHRRVKHYGFEFRYDNNNVDKDKPLPLGIPQECLPVLQRCVTDKLIPFMPDQLTVNQYESGQGIPPHVDTHSAFEDAIVSLSLGAQTVMEFRHPDGRLVPVVLPGRSLLVMRGESRFLWTHGITPRKFDVVPASDPQCPAHEKPDLQAHSSLTLKKRSTRTSFTFRRIRHEPCRCAFPSACDSQGPSTPSASSPPLPSLPFSHAAAAHLEEEYVHRVYDAIASHFSSTRHSPWPRVCHFLSSLPAGSVLADVGCGNGKYLAVNPEVVAVGCDRSRALIQICAERGFQAFVSDALDVPLRTASCDACISIAVIHHFSTQERRLAAVKELLRLLRPGGQALIYVWAFEQEFNKQRSKYLKDRDKEPPGNQNATENGSERSREPPCTSTVSTSRHSEDQHRTGDDRGDFSKSTDSKLSVHTNRTAFNSQDLLVPWHLKGGQKREEEESAEGVTKDKRSETSKKFSENSSSAYGWSSVNGSEHDPDNGPASDSSRTTHSSDSSSSIFHRYYHVFQQGELEQLCSQVAEVQVQSSYHDQGNWCVLLEKETN